MSTSKKRGRSEGGDDTVLVMQGQTEEERRALRKEQRVLLDRLNDRQQEIIQLDSEAYSEERKSNNVLFSKVRFTRELGNDGENLVVLGDLAMQRSATLAHSVAQYSCKDMCDKLRQEFGGKRGGVWTALGAETAHLFRAPANLEFMCGPLEQPEPKAKARQKRSKNTDDENDMTETQYETLDYSKNTQAGESHETAKQEEATNKRLQHLLKVMGGHPDAGADLMRLLVSPNAFHETVENFFDLSFLVKDGKASVALDRDGLPVTALAEPPEDAVEKHQTVVVLGPDDAKRIARLWAIDTPALVRQD